MRVGKNRSLIYGVGINDCPSPVASSVKISGKTVNTWVLPQYQVWRSILKRCYCEKSLLATPSYKGCTVCDDWLKFTEFEKWYLLQNWQNNHVDKDLLFVGNKIYSPETCCLISQETNHFINDCCSRRGDCLLWVYFRKDRQKFVSQVKCSVTGKHLKLGYFDCELTAHKVAQEKKHEASMKMAKMQSDPRAEQALMVRYAPDKDWTNR